ncbi:MAG: rRNA maturation RNase YbeY [Clostridia bacterium]|nr:rRNA maturation RNase YbeY [Clostridia bacterium]
MALKADISFSGGIEKNDFLIKTAEEVSAGCIRGGRHDFSVAVTITGNAEIKRLNREFRGIDNETDVLSFPLLDARNGRLSWNRADMDDETGCIMLGDVVVSIEKAAEQAELYGHSLEREVAFLVCHGMLHLLGYDHAGKRDEARMTKKQSKVLDKLGYKR